MAMGTQTTSATTRTQRRLEMSLSSNALAVLAVAVLSLSSVRAETGGSDLADSLSVRAAKEKEQEAKRLLEVGKVDEAVEACRAGYVIEPAPRWLFNIAVIYNINDRPTEALEWIQRLEGKSSELNTRSLIAVAKLRSEAEAKLAARTTLPTKPSTSVSSRTVPTTLEPSVAVVARPETTSASVWYQDPIGWSLVGIGGVGLGSSVLFFANSASLRGDADVATDEIKRTDLRNKADRRQTLGVVALGIGGAALIAGLVKLAITPSSPDGAAVGVARTRGGSSVWVRVRW